VKTSFLFLPLFTLGVALFIQQPAPPNPAPVPPVPSLPSSHAPATRSQDGFLDASRKTFNFRRAQLNLPPLHPHPKAIITLAELEDSLDPVPAGLSPLFQRLQARIPEFHEIGATFLTAASHELLLQKLAAWSELAEPEYTHFAVRLVAAPRQGRVACLATVGRRLPPLRLPISQSTAGTVFDTCRVCGKGHGLSLRQQQHTTLIIHCPHCREPYNLLAADSDGNWRRANQFLHGFDAISAEAGLSHYDQVLSIWKQVDARCRYQLDAQRLAGNDSWNLPRQTFERALGDCEDTSLLLADALIDNGFEARVVLGRQGGQGHAWCVVRLNGVSYIIESTLQGVERFRRIPRLDDLALEYHPQMLFDRDHLYFKRHDQWTSDYWSERNWRKIACPEEGRPAPARPRENRIAARSRSAAN